MASWITVVAPYLPEIVRLARPMFTRKPPAPDDSLQRRLDLVDTQVAELQNAAGQNADAIAKLASDMQKTLDALQLGAQRMERQLASATRLALVACTAAALAFALAAWALAR
jgi:hypothetical protein